MACGNQGRDIFRDDADRLRWLKTLDEACQKTGWHVHAYVLMSNHYHLLVETPEGNLVAGMKWVSHRLKMEYYTRVTGAGATETETRTETKTNATTIDNEFGTFEITGYDPTVLYF